MFESHDSVYRSLFDTALEGMLVASEEGELLDANAGACSMLGYEWEELIGMDLRALVDPDEERWEVVPVGAADGGEREFRFVRRDGTTLDARVEFTREPGATPEDGGGRLGLIFRDRPKREDTGARVGGASLENGPEPGNPHGADNTVRYVSPAVERILGYAPKELIGVCALDLVHPDDLTLAIREAREAGDYGRSKSPPIRYRSKDGSWVHLENAASDPTVGCGVEGQKATGRRESGEAPRPGEDRYRALVRGSSRALLIIDTDDAVLYGNPAVGEVLGLNTDALFGKSILEYVHPEDRERARRAIAEASKNAGSVTSVEFRLGRADGSWRQLRARIVNTTTDRGIGRIVVDLNDVTEQKQTEEALRRSEDRYRAVVEQSTESIFTVDVRSMRIIEANSVLCETLGYTPEELEKMTLYDLMAHDPESVDASVRYTLEEKRGRVDERKYRCKDGSLADVEVYASIMPHAGDDLLCIVAHDVTGRKQTEANLRRSLGVLLALREAGQILGSTLETEEIVTRLLTIMRGVSGLTAAVISVEDEVGQTRIWREVGLEGLWRKARYAPQAEAARRAVFDAGEHRLFRLQSPEPGSRHLVGLCLPLRMKERIAGVLEAYGPESLAEDDAVEILRSLAAQAASALENASLYGELAERERRLADLVGQLFVAQEEERRRVAYEVHDGLAQVAAAAHQHLQGFARFYPPATDESRELLSRTLELVQRTVGEARRTIANLRPTALDDFGLRTALRLETEKLREEGWRVDYESNMAENERLPVAVETAFFRIAQEAITNARRHAETRRARVTLDHVDGRARLVIRDWGHGFDPSAPRVGNGPGERVGLNSMQERTSLLGGEFRVQSWPDAGTLITAEIPLQDGGLPEDVPGLHEDAGLLAGEGKL